MDHADNLQLDSQAMEHSSLNLQTGSISSARRSQFVKPGFIDERYDVCEKGEAVALSQEIPRRARLNPFVFPSDTDLRFVVLIVSILASSLFIYNVLGDLTLFGFLKASTLCVLHNPAIQAARQSQSPQVLDAASAAFGKCQLPFLFPHTLLLFGGLLLLLGVATVIYWLIPPWKLINGKFVPLSSANAPEVVAYLAQLCAEAGLTLRPRFVWNPLKFTGSALAFGRFGRYYIALTGGLVTLFSTDQAAFRAIMLHELAHLRNRDVNKTYFAIAIWWAFVTVALVPFAATLLFKHSSLGLYINVCIVMLALLVYLSFKGVLRTRELYADVRASIWDSAETLSRILQSLPPLPGWWRRLKNFHPDPQKRYQMLRETQRLFQIDLWVIFSLGLAIGVAFPNIEELCEECFSMLVPVSIYSHTVPNTGLSFPELSALGAALISASLIVGIVGINIWRVAFATLIEGQPQRGTGRLALCLGVGLIIGTFLSPSLDNFTVEFSLQGFAEQCLSNLPWALLLLISLILFFRWFATGAWIWLEITIKKKSPRLIYRMSLTLAGVILAIWLTQLFLFRSLSTIAPLAMIDLAHLNLFSLQEIFVNTISEPASLLAFIGLWAFPLSAWFWHRGAATTARPDWAFLDTPSPCLSLSYQNVIRFPPIITGGLLGGFVYCGLQVIIQRWWHLSVPPVQHTDQFISLFYWSDIALAALIQAYVAGIVATRVRLLSEPHGLIAAFVASCIMTIGFLGVNRLFGGGLDAFFVWYVLLCIVNGGALLALPVTLVASTIARHRSNKPASSDPLL